MSVNARSPRYDTVLRGAMVIDGSGRPPFKADLAIRKDRVAAIGELNGVRGSTDVDVRSRYLAPGFIDAHSHDDQACIGDPAMRSKLGQGVTTVVVGNCGISLAPLNRPPALPEPLNLLGDSSEYRFADFRSYFDAVDAAMPAINVVSLVGHNTLRLATMPDLDRTATPRELRMMLELLDEAMRAGAAGLSGGTYYAIGSAADNSEIIPLVKKVADYDGVYVSHARDEFDLLLDSLSEPLAAARIGGAPLVLSSFRCAGPPALRHGNTTLPFLDKISTTQTIGLDCCPYGAGPGALNPRYNENGDRILISRSLHHPEMSGKYLFDVASGWDCTVPEAVRRLMPGGASYFQYSDDEVVVKIRHPLAMVGTGGFPVDTHPHPGRYGAFVRVVRRHVLDRNDLSLEAAVHKMTGLTANRFKIARRGVLAAGNFADIVVLDLATVRDRATYDEPKRIAAGIEYVFVNGRLSWGVGSGTSRGAGRLLRNTHAHE